MAGRGLACGGCETVMAGRGVTCRGTSFHDLRVIQSFQCRVPSVRWFRLGFARVRKGPAGASPPTWRVLATLRVNTRSLQRRCSRARVALEGFNAKRHTKQSAIKASPGCKKAGARTPLRG
jgi:hypothetical protein